jgi:putative membrane protein
MMWNWDGSWSNGMAGGGWLMFFGMILVTVAVVLLVVYLVRQTTGAPGSQTQALPPSAAVPAPETPRDILKRRYANGEIDREEYLQKLSDL